MTDPSADAVVLTRRIAAPCADVFRACSDPALVQLWLAPGAVVVEHIEVDLTIGGRFHLQTRAPDGTMHRITGVYREIEADRRLVQTWIYDGPLDLEAGRETLLSIDLSPIGDASTDLTLTHSHVATEAARAAYAEDWPSCLDKLARAVG